MHETILIAGSGGQGVLFAGMVLAQSALLCGYNATFFPAYGAEMRGGTAHCTVIIADIEIGSPVVTRFHHMIMLNEQSFRKFNDRLLSVGGILIINTSLIPEQKRLAAATVINIPATQIADKKLSNIRVANVVALGAYLEAQKRINAHAVEQSLQMILRGKDNLIAVNKEALHEGSSFRYEHAHS
jgi:2-oxoglutarate ferredoxin oxidoreductase subunit gamma